MAMTAEYARAYYLKNRERIAAQRRARRAESPEKVRAQEIEWRANRSPTAKKHRGERNRIYQAARRAADPGYREKALNRVRRYRAAHRERLLARRREIYAQRREEERERIRLYGQTAKGKIARKASCSRRRARKRGIGSGVTTAELKRVLGARICHICGKRFTGADPPTVDHVIPLAEGGEHRITNLAAAHLFCNMQKRSRAENPLNGQGFLL